MPINAFGENLATAGAVDTSTPVEDKTVLGKDDFMTLLLVQLQNQDPTEPMESGTILTQTSQLAGLEAASNTNAALEALAASLGATDQFAAVSAIGKRADLGSDAISYKRGEVSEFEVYFPEDIATGTIKITDLEDNLIAVVFVEVEDKDGKEIDKLDAGVYKFEWDGLDSEGKPVDTGIYRVNAEYVTPDGEKLETRLGAYPIESIRFENGKAFAKLGSSYVAMDKIVEIY